MLRGFDRRRSRQVLACMLSSHTSWTTARSRELFPYSLLDKCHRPPSWHGLLALSLSKGLGRGDHVAESRARRPCHTRTALQVLPSWLGGTVVVLFLAGSHCSAQLPPPPKVITPQGEAPVFEDEYFTDYHQNPCDFDTDGDFERIAGFGAGLAGRDVRGGSLSFTTSEEDNCFYFGRWLYPKGRLDIPDENIGYAWPMYGVSFLKVRLKQSLESSTWNIGYRVIRGARGNVPGQTGWVAKGTKVEGTAWQELSLAVLIRGRNWRALYFETVEPGNTVSIDHIKVVNVRTPVCYRKSIVLKARPVYAKLRTNLATEYFVYAKVFSVTADLVAAETELADLPKKLVRERLDAFAYCKGLPAGKGELFAEKWRTGKSFEELLQDIAALEAIHQKGNQLRVVNISGMTPLRRFLASIGRYRAIEAPPEPRERSGSLLVRVRAVRAWPSYF